MPATARSSTLHIKQYQLYNRGVSDTKCVRKDTDAMSASTMCKSHFGHIHVDCT